MSPDILLDGKANAKGSVRAETIRSETFAQAAWARKKIDNWYFVGYFIHGKDQKSLRSHKTAAASQAFTL